MIKDIDKSKLILVHDRNDKINDVSLETKEIGYYKDSWNRFKKNKASLIAFYIICVIMFFVAFGPYLKDYDLYEEEPIEAARLGNLTPKIPVVEKLGIFDGTKNVTSGKNFILNMYQDDYGKGIIISGIPQELIDNPNHPDYENVTKLTVKVNYYSYQNYVKSYIPEDYYAVVADNENGEEYKDPLASVTRTLTQDQFDDYLEKNYIIDILKIIESVNPDNEEEIDYQYKVRMDQFKLSLQQEPDDVYFWFGTTNEGRDLFTLIWKGARISLLMALVVTIINTVIGLTVGAIAGYYGGIIDLMMDRLVEIISSIPLLSLLVLLMLRFPERVMLVVILSFTLNGWIGSYSTGRMQFYRFKNREYVFAARTLGADDGRIMFKHIFPNTLGYIVTGLALSIPLFVFTEASFAFLGIIDYGKTTSVGMLIDNGQKVMNKHPHLLLFPSFYIATLMIAFNLFGNGLRDAFNPSLRGVE